MCIRDRLQSVDTYEGFPVNAKALEMQAAADRSMAEAYTTYDIDGSTAELSLIHIFSTNSEPDMEKKRSVLPCRRVSS